MKIAIGNDHTALEMKEAIKAYVEQKGYEVIDFGTNSSESCDYPAYGEKVGRAVASGEADYGIAICGTGIGIGLFFGLFVFALVLCKGDLLCSFFTTDAPVIANGYAYLKGFALETILTAILFSMIGYFNGSGKTVFVMAQGLFQTLLVRLPMAYIMSIQPNASLTMIGLAAPTSTAVGVLLNVCFFLYLDRKAKKQG